MQHNHVGAAFGLPPKTKHSLMGIRYANEPGGAPPAAPPAPEPAPAPPAPGTPPEPAKPPWSSDAEFDPDRAWKRIQAQATDLDAAKAERDKYKKLAEDAEAATLTEQQKLQKERDDAVTSGTGLASENAKLRAALKHQLSEEDLALLGDGTPEDIEARAAKLAERLGGTPTPQLPGKPTPTPRGGTDPDQAPEITDPAALAALIPR